MSWWPPGSTAGPTLPRWGALQLAVKRAAAPLAEAARRGKDFTSLTSEELADDPPPDTAGWYLTRAWSQMMDTPDVGVALTHKVLHHKQPHLFPLLDALTADALRNAPGGRNIWQQIHAEISDARQDFEDLRAWFAPVAAARGGVPLGLPRLHDILLWLHAAGQWDDALAAGESAG
jgi:hypothetical protein